MNLPEVNNIVLHIYKAFFLTLKKEKQTSFAETIILLSTFGSFLFCGRLIPAALQVAQHSREFTEHQIDRDLTSSRPSPHAKERSRSEEPFLAPSHLA